MTLYSPWNHKVTSTRRNHPVRCNGWHRDCCEHSLHINWMENWKMICLSLDSLRWRVGEKMDKKREWNEVIQWMIGNLLKQQICWKISFSSFSVQLNGWMQSNVHVGCKQKNNKQTARSLCKRWCRFTLNDFT